MSSPNHAKPRVSVLILALAVIACNAQASVQPTAWPTVDPNGIAQTQAAQVTTAPTPVLGAISETATPAERTHIVASGETLSGIAALYGIDMGQLLAANQLSVTDTIIPGQVLIIPNAGSTYPTMAAVTPTPDPAVIGNALYEYSIDRLTVRSYGNATIKRESFFARTDAYEMYSFSYMTPEFETGRSLRVTGLMNIPRGGTAPYPVAILLHGGIDQDAYSQGDDTAGQADYLARAGYLTLAPDYRTYNETEGSGRPFKLTWVVDVMALIEALPSLPEADPERIGVMGHSRGGGMAGHIMVLAPHVDAAVLYAPLHLDQAVVWDIYATVFGSTWPFDDAVKYGSPETNPVGFDIISPYNYLNRVQMPVQIHHGTKDAVLPVDWSIDLANQLAAHGKTVEYYEYPVGEHTLVGDDWRTMMDRTQAFFDQYVK